MRAVDGQAARATGNSLAAQNDEPEPVFSEAELIEGDLLRATDKATRRLARDVRAGVEEQVQRLRDGGLL